MSSHLFALPVTSWHSTQPLTAAAHSSRKRKRKHVRSPHGESAPLQLTLEAEVDSETTRNSPRRTILTPDDIYQYSVAGQPPDQERPGHHFPHRSGQKPWHKNAEAPVDVHPEDESRGASTHGVTLRQQHLAVITAILHRCILERDFERAGRALGLIICDEIQGHPVDIRSQGRWGIGAEILLRKGQATETPDSPVITRTGFELARRYYERLAVLHPFHRAHKDSYDERDFNLALLGLWIYVAHEDAKRIREMDNGFDEDHSATGSTERGGGFRQELEEARLIARRMDDLMITPLYGHNVEFMRLRAMVALWIADLSQEVGEDHEDGDHAMELDGAKSVETSLAASMSEVDLNIEDTRRYRRRPVMTGEAKQSQARAEELLSLVEGRLGM